MSNQIVRKYFESTIKAWAGEQNPVIPIAFENVQFVKPSSGTFLELFLIPTVTIDVSVDGTRKRYVGLFQVNCWAKSGTGMGQVETLVKSIIDLFPVVPKTSSVSVEKTPSTRTAILDTSGWVLVPITIQYRYEE